MPDPTPEDFARDPEADMAACARAPYGPWFVNPRTEQICHGDPDDDGENFPIDDPDADDFICLARTALPAYIRLAAYYKAEAERLRDKQCGQSAARDYVRGMLKEGET